jgi:hypothetical protein
MLASAPQPLSAATSFGLPIQFVNDNRRYHSQTGDRRETWGSGLIVMTAINPRGSLSSGSSTCRKAGGDRGGPAAGYPRRSRGAGWRSGRQRWSHTWHGNRLRLVVKGAPGSGKSFLTRYAAASLAIESANRIREREVRRSKWPRRSRRRQEGLRKLAVWTPPRLGSAELPSPPRRIKKPAGRLREMAR